MTHAKRILTAGLAVGAIVTITATLAATRPPLPPTPRSLPPWCELACPPNDAQPALLPRTSSPQRCWGTDDRAYERQPDGSWTPTAARNPIDSATYPDCAPAPRTSTNTRPTRDRPPVTSQGPHGAIYATA
jgi:hypothetical protein